jgi:hypothetical protein
MSLDEVMIQRVTFFKNQNLHWKDRLSIKIIRAKVIPEILSENERHFLKSF